METLKKRARIGTTYAVDSETNEVYTLLIFQEFHANKLNENGDPRWFKVGNEEYEYNKKLVSKTDEGFILDGKILTAQ